MLPPKLKPWLMLMPSLSQPEQTASAVRYTARIARGSVYLDREVCDLYLPGVASITMINRDGRAYLLPLHGSDSGWLLKMRNARGDRVVHALQFLFMLGLDADTEMQVPVRWDSGMAGLLLEGLGDGKQDIEDPV